MWCVVLVFHLISRVEKNINHFSVNEMLCHFQFVVIKNNRAMNIFVHVPWYMYVHIFLFLTDVYLRVEELGHRVCLPSKLLANTKFLPKVLYQFAFILANE